MSLARRAAGAAFWVAVTTYSSQFVAFFANIALMRLIAPDAFGVLAMALVFSTFARKLVGFGFNHALIHKQGDLPTAVGAHLALNLGSGVLVLLAAVAAFPFVAEAYDRLTAFVLLGVAVEAGLEYAGYTPRLLMEKQVRFKGVMLINFAVTTGINLVAILAALLWPNVWVLLFRIAGAQLATTIGYWWLKPRPEIAWPTRAMFRWFFSFGAPLWIAGIATFAVLQFDDFLVGTILDKTTLGYYTRAYALAVLPTTMVGHIVARVAFPIYSQVQHDHAKLSEAFSTVMRLIVLLSAPAAIGLAYCAPEFVAVVFGKTWAPMAVLVRYLVVYELLRPMFDDVGELFTAIGQPKKISRIQLAQAGVMVLAGPLFVYFFKAAGAALVAGLVMLVGVLLAYKELRPHVTISIRDVMAVPVGLCLAAAGLSALLLRHVAPASAWGLLLAKAGLFGGLTIGLIGAVQGRRLWSEFTRLKARLQKREAT